MSSAVFGKTMENVRKHRGITLVTTERRRNYLLFEPNDHTTKFFTENLLPMEMRKTEILMNKPAYLELSILEVNKILIYEFWYDYAKPKYREKAKLSYMDTDSFIVYIKTDDIYKDIANSFIVYIKADDVYDDMAEDVETRFDTLNHELDEPLPKEKRKN